MNLYFPLKARHRPPIRIRYFSDFQSSLNCKKKVEQICQSHLIPTYGRDFVLTDGEDYTHAILLNYPMPILTVPKERVVGFAFEPPEYLSITDEFIEYAKRYIGKYIVGYSELPAPFVQGFAYMWHIVPPSLSTKQKICSIMVSEKRITWGHEYRHRLVEKILALGLPIDIFGRGCQVYAGVYKNDKRLRGSFKEMDDEMYANYMFHIAIENTSHPHYISEKVLNPLLCGSTPLYWGASQIGEYFPDMTYEMTGDIDEDMNRIITVVKDPLLFVKKINVSMVRDKTNILKNVLSIVK